MKSLVIYAHPNPLSFNAALAKVTEEELARKGEVRVKDLYRMNWNPVLSEQDFKDFHLGKIPADIQKEQEDIAGADGLVLIAPVWWYSVPAILKGYIDRVFSIGFAYEYTDSGPRGLLTDKKALVITTSGADEKTAQQSGMLEAVKNSMVDGLFGFCGFKSFQYRNLFSVTTVSDADRKQLLSDTRKLIQETF